MIVYVPMTRWEKTKMIKKRFYWNLGVYPDLNNPTTFNEKVQWMKLNYRDFRAAKLADKVAVREYITENIGEEYLVDAIGIYDNAKDIDWGALPEKFVAKINNGCGLNIVCTDKNLLNQVEVEDKLNDWLKPINGHYWRKNGFEWQYKHMKPKILIEKYIGGKNGTINEYKFMYINGKCEFIQVPTERDAGNQFNVKLTFFNKKWQKTQFHRSDHELSEKNIKKPNNLNEMLRISKKLAEGFPVCRVDLYSVNGKIKFGELTFTPSNGLFPFSPKSWDQKFGKKIILPKPNTWTLFEWRPVEIFLKTRQEDKSKKICKGNINDK